MTKFRGKLELGTETEGVTKVWKNFMSQRVIFICDHFLECNCHTTENTVQNTS
jgi:hypothetical protein